jgi:hypothetical protein
MYKFDDRLIDVSEHAGSFVPGYRYIASRDFDPDEPYGYGDTFRDAIKDLLLIEVEREEDRRSEALFESKEAFEQAIDAEAESMLKRIDDMIDAQLDYKYCNEPTEAV